jgi:hypothetical protein
VPVCAMCGYCSDKVGWQLLHGVYLHTSYNVYAFTCTTGYLDLQHPVFVSLPAA